MKQETTKLVLTIAGALACIGTCAAAQAASIQGMTPEVHASVWQEDAQEVASVFINGKELVAFHAPAGSGVAASKADDLASQLQDCLDDKKFDPNNLLPAKAGTRAIIQNGGRTLLSFDTTADKKHVHSPALQIAWKVVNSIRSAYNSPLLPPSYLKLLGESSEQIASEKSAAADCFSGQASWYGPRFHGRKTSDGHRFDQEKMTAAHRSLPFGTKLLVMNRKTGNTCVVEINDRGPFVGDRVIDLSRGAARKLDMLSSGVALVDCLILNTN